MGGWNRREEENKKKKIKKKDEKHLQHAGNIWFHIRRLKRKLHKDKTLMF